MQRTVHTTEADLARTVPLELEDRLASPRSWSLDHGSRDGPQPERLATGYGWVRGAHD